MTSGTVDVVETAIGSNVDVGAVATAPVPQPARIADNASIPTITAMRAFTTIDPLRLFKS